MNKIFKILILVLLFLHQISIAREETYTESADKIFTVAISVISSFKYDLKEINYSRGKAIFTSQTDSYALDVMQNSKLTTVKIQEINSSTDSTKATIDNIFQQLTKIYGTKE